MQYIIDYIIENWFWLIPSILSVVEFLFLMIFRRNKIVDNSISSRLIGLINEAEDYFDKPGSGKEKLVFVINRYQALYGHDYISNNLLKQFIENILETPQKKGR